MIDCTDIFWHHCDKGAGVMLGAMMLALFRQQHRHEEAMQEARLREDQVRKLRDPIIQGGQG